MPEFLYGIAFNGPISIANSGKIRIYNTANPVTPVDTIDMSANTVVISPNIGITNNIQPHSLFSGDSQVVNYFPVIINGSTAAIYPHSGVMTSNQTYYVTMDSGIVADTNGAYFDGISSTNTWQFSTKPTGPANATNLVVAADGSGDFVTVQGAVDSILPGNTNYTLINIHDGNYVEIVDITGKNNLTFSGQSRHGTLVGYPNNFNLISATAGRMAFKVNSSDIKLENLTVTNGTPQGGSQAEALLIYNSGLRCVVDNCDIVSRQDTILINASTSQGYFYNCKVIGNFDYIWGSGVGYFDTCVFHTLTNALSSSYNLTAARTQTSSAFSATTPWVNPNGATYSAYGFSFVNCTVEADSGVTGITLAGSNGTSGGLDSWVDCNMDTNAYVTPTTTLSNNYVFWQNSDMDITGAYPVSFANVQTIGVTNNDPRLMASTNITTWFSGWQPQIAPDITTNPVSQFVAGGASAQFSISATGIPAASYQWLFNGSPVGTNGPAYAITAANANYAGTYTEVVSNPSGSVTSSPAILTVGNTAPTLGSISDQTVNVGVTVTVNDVATDPDVPAQTLAYSLLSGPSGASVAPATGTFTWRPQVSAAGTTNPVQVVVTDNGTPNLSATNGFNVIVNPLTQPNLATPSYTNGQFSLSVSGEVGPDYALQVTTDLSSGTWVTLLETNSPPSPFTFTDINATNAQQFYRILVGPPLP
jgi:pectin methylesterase-like acyl-CoA thioesterase